MDPEDHFDDCYVEAFEHDDYSEPMGSCDWCGANLYGGEIDSGELCDQCQLLASWADELNAEADLGPDGKPSERNP